MALSETYQPFKPDIHPIQSGLGYIRSAAEQVRISYRDRSKAAAYVSESFRNYGPVQILQTEYLPGTPDMPDIRVRQTAAITNQYTGHTHQVLITSPMGQQGKTKAATAHIVGITQRPTSGNALLAYNATSDANPEKTNIAFSTPGLGDDGIESRLTFRQSISMSFRETAGGQLDIAQLLVPDQPVHFKTFSMGTAIFMETSERNAKTGQLEIASASLFSPAVVAPDEAMPILGQEFPQYAYRIELEKAAERKFGRIALLLQAFHEFEPAYVGNVRELLRGTDEATYLRVVGRQPTIVIRGTDDPAARSRLHSIAKAALPGSFQILDKPGHGHSINNSSYAEEIAADDRRLIDLATSERYSLSLAA